MIVCYNSETLKPYHVIDHYPEGYTPDDEHWFKQDEWIPFAEMYLERQADGEVVAKRRAPAPTIVGPETLKVNVEAILTGIPEGSSVIVNGATLGMMDASGALEFTPQTAGTYVFRFESNTTMPKEIRLEALS